MTLVVIKVIKSLGIPTTALKSKIIKVIRYVISHTYQLPTALKSKDYLRYGESYPHINFGEDWPRNCAYLRISIWWVIKVIKGD